MSGGRASRVRRMGVLRGLVSDIQIGVLGEEDELGQGMTCLAPTRISRRDFEGHDPMRNVVHMRQGSKTLARKDILEQQLLIHAVQGRASGHDSPVDAVLFPVFEQPLEKHQLDQSTYMSLDNAQATDMGEGLPLQPVGQGNRLLQRQRLVLVRLDAGGPQRRAVHLGFRQQDHDAILGIHRLGHAQTNGDFRHVTGVGLLPYLNRLAQICFIANQTHRERQTLLGHGVVVAVVGLERKLAGHDGSGRGHALKIHVGT